MTLLLISSEATLLPVLREHLREALLGIEVVGHCYNLAVGWQAIQLLMPDVLIVDFRGLNVHIKELEQLLSAPKIHIVILTANSKIIPQNDNLTALYNQPIDWTALMDVLSNIKAKKSN